MNFRPLLLSKTLEQFELWRVAEADLTMKAAPVIVW
jgi:hypothetical protein